MKSSRRTGRTTRMIEAAKKAAKEGRAVYIICATQDQVNWMKSHIKDGLGIKIESPSSVPYFNWEMLWSPGAHPNCRFFVDHHAIENRFSRMLEELHKYDI